MPINSTLDVVIQEDDLVVLGPPSTVDISLDIGAQGDPGSQIYTGAFDPNTVTVAQFTTLYGAAPAANDLFLRTEVGEYYGTFYSYVNVPGGTQWEPVLEIINAVELFLELNTDFVLSASAGGTGIDNGTSTFTFAGDIEFAGAYDVTLTSTGNTSLTLPTSGNVAVLENTLDDFAATTSAQLASIITDETGTGSLVFGTSPQITTSLTTNSTTFSLLNTTATTLNFGGAATNLTIGANEAGTTTIRTAATNLTGDLRIGGGDLTVTESTFNLANTTATTVNFAGAATSLNMGAGSGTTTINNDLTVDGDLIVNGSTTTVNSTIVTIDDPVFVLGGDSAPVADDNKDRGIEFRWHDGSTAKDGFFGFDDSTGRFTFIPDATNTSEVFSGTPGDIEVNDIIANDVAVNGGDITTTATTFNLVNTDATTVNFAGAATGLSVGASTGLTTINNDLLISASHLATVDAAQFTTTPGVSASVGRLMWNDDDGTLDLGLKGGNVTLQVGQEFVARAFNNSASVINDGDIVVIDGAQGQRVSVTLADASSVDSGHAFGMATETIGVGEEGFITTQGTVRHVDTYIDGTSEGAEIYLSPTTAGAWTVTRPSAPDHAVRIGWIQREHAVSGSIYIKIDSGDHLEWLHDVLITSASANDVLRYNAASSIWVNEDISTVVNSASTINIQNLNVAGNAEITGNLTVSGSVSYLNTEQVLIEDNIIVLNSNVSASPTLNAGIEIERGTESNVSIIWNETLDQWEFTNDGTVYNALGSGTGEGGFTNHFLMMGA